MPATHLLNVDALDAFDIDEMLGEGAMGAAWKARHRRSGEYVAIKTIRGANDDDERRRLFLREAGSLAAMEHDGIVRILDFGHASDAPPPLDSDTLYIVMELAQGGSLQPASIDSWAQTRRLALQILDALAHAHCRQRIHLDLKPENVLIRGASEAGPRYLLADFGIAAMAGEAEDDDQIYGTPAYMAPEQGLGQRSLFGPWTDLYALGCLCWQVVTGAVPFQGSNLIGLINAHVNQPLPRFSARFDVPSGLVSWLGRLLTKSPSDRFSTAADAAHALCQLDALVTSAPQEAPTGVNPSEPATLGPTQPVGEPTFMLTTIAAVAAEQVSGRPRPPSRDRGTSPTSGAPPFPDDWRHDQGVVRRLQLEDAGAGLFDLREPPFVGRETERDWLWAWFGRVCDSAGPEHVVVCGEAGVGTSRLLKWFARRLLELGQARLLRLDLAERTWVAALRRAGLKLIGTSNKDIDALARQVELRLPGVPVELVAKLAAMDVDNSDRVELFSSLGELLAELACERPVVVMADHVRFDTLGFDFAEYFARRYPQARVLFVSAICTDEASPVVGARADHLGERRLELEPLNESEVRTFIEHTLTLADDELSRLLEATDCDPSYARQIIARWLETGSLVPEADGYRATNQAPATQESLWQQRLEDLFGPEEFVEHTMLVLSAAAVLGTSVDRRCWRAVCDRLEASIDEDILTSLARRGFVDASDTDWCFAQPGLRESLLAHLADQPYRDSVYAAAAAVLRSQQDRISEVRAAECLIHIGQLSEALYLLRSASYRCNPTEAIALHHWAEQLLSDQQSSSLVSERIVTLAELAAENLQNGHLDAAQVYIERLEEIVDEDTDPILASELEILQGYRALFANTPSEGLEPALSALRTCEEHGDVIDVVSCLSLVGDLCLYDRQFGRARRYLDKARRLSETESTYQWRWADFRLGMLALHDGQLDRAEELLVECMDYFRSTDDRYGIIFSAENLGQLAHQRADFDTATARLEQALLEARVAGYRGVVTMHERLGRLHAHLGEAETGLEHLEEVRRSAQREGFDLMVWYYWDALLEALARLGRWDRFESLLIEARATSARPGLHAPAIAQTFERVAAHCADSARPDFSEAASRLAASLVV